MRLFVGGVIFFFVVVGEGCGLLKVVGDIEGEGFV